MSVYQSRQEVPEKEKWDLSDLYKDLSLWEKDYRKIEEMVQELKEFDGKISNGKSLYQYLKKKEETSYIFNHVYAYAMLKLDEDTRDSHSQSLLEKAKSLSVKFSGANAFFLPYL